MKISKIKLILITAIATAGLMPATVFAAQISFEPASLALPQKQPYSATIMLDTQGESINAIEGTIAINEFLGETSSVTDSGSVVTYWVDRPELTDSARTIDFRGAIPGGYVGKGILFTLVLPPYEGERIDTPFKLSGIKAFRNDGLGTQAQVVIENFSFGVSVAPDSSVVEQLYVDESRKDNIAPEIFSPQISRDDRVLDGKWFINFSTQDKQSGIDRYEIQEIRSGKIDAGKWKRAENPYQLEDQELHSFIYVIAIDRQGNERVIKVFPRNPLPWYSNYAQLLIVAGALTLLVAGSYLYNRRKTSLQNQYK